MPVQVASLFGVLNLDDTQFKRKMGDAERGMTGLGGRMRDLGGNMQRFGGQMTLITAPLALGLGVAISQTREFDRTMTNVFAITGQAGDAAAALRNTLLSYGGDTVAGPQRVAEAYYEIVSGVADASTHMAILDAAVRTSEAGQADLTATTSALISTMNSYKLSAEDAAYVSDVFTQTVGMGVLSMDEMATALPQATGLAAQFGIELSEVGGSLAFLTTQGFSAGQSATFLRSMISTLLNPTAELETAITGLGFSSGQAMLESLGLVGSYQLLAQQPGGLAGLITNQEALTGSLILSQDAATGFLTDYTAGIDGATERAGAIQDQTEGWDKLRSKLEEVSIHVGTQLSPVLMDLVDNAILPAITEVTRWADENPELFRTLVLVTGAVVLLGPVIAALGTAISVVGTAFTAAKAGMMLFSGGAMAAVGPILAVGAAIAGVIAAIHEFNRLTNEAAASANQALGGQLASGAISAQQLRDQAFASTAQQFGGGLVGDIMARLFYENIARGAETGQFNMVDTRADGGPVSGGAPYLVGERGPELFVPGGAGSIFPAGATAEMMGGVQIGSVTIHASSFEGGRAAADGFQERLMEIRRRRG